MFFSGGDYSTLMLSLGAAVALALLLRRGRKMQARNKQSSPLELPEKFEPRAVPLVDAPKEIVRWQVEMHEQARDLQGELQTKLTTMQVLIRQAEQASARLEQAIDRCERLGLTGARDPLRELEQMQQFDAESALAALDRLRAELRHGSHAVAPLTADQTSAVRRLANEGRSAAQISRELGLPRGDVEWTLNAWASRS